MMPDPDRPHQPWLGRRLWDAIREPRRIKLVYLAIYLVLVVASVIALIEPPAILLTEAGNLASYVWAGMILTGALLCLVAVLPGWLWLERWGIALTCTGALIYTAVAWSVDVTDRGTHALDIAALVILVIVVGPLRLWLMDPYQYQPRVERRGGWRTRPRS